MRKQYVVDAVRRVGCVMMRLLRNAMIARAFAVLPVTRQNEFELRKQLAR
jgi:hypothetical protein